MTRPPYQTEQRRLHSDGVDTAQRLHQTNSAFYKTKQKTQVLHNRQYEPEFTLKPLLPCLVNLQEGFSSQAYCVHLSYSCRHRSKRQIRNILYIQHSDRPITNSWYEETRSADPACIPLGISIPRHLASSRSFTLSSSPTLTPLFSKFSLSLTR